VLAARRRYVECERAIPGFFLEGPFISPEPGAVGTHPVEWVHPPDLKLFDRFQYAAEGLVKMVNLAAEIPVMPPGEYKVCGADARLEANGLLWNPSRNCLVGATTPIARMMKLLQERVGLTADECRAVGRENPLRLIGG
jgi:hypothetical protein